MRRWKKKEKRRHRLSFGRASLLLRREKEEEDRESGLTTKLTGCGTISQKNVKKQPLMPFYQRS